MPQAGSNPRVSTRWKLTLKLQKSVATPSWKLSQKGMGAIFAQNWECNNQDLISCKKKSPEMPRTKKKNSRKTNSSWEARKTRYSTTMEEHVQEVWGFLISRVSFGLSAILNYCHHGSQGHETYESDEGKGWH